MLFGTFIQATIDSVKMCAFGGEELGLSNVPTLIMAKCVVGPK
jgi:hypothetical protein